MMANMPPEAMAGYELRHDGAMPLNAWANMSRRMMANDAPDAWADEPNDGMHAPEMMANMAQR
ncbi:MAG: hypothetical protein CM15mP54_14260 [Paracoccaceae bacterium]|nr:MAG: hypothetical protein CM15mP54_14260 [Paracoccaceae bacterium]